MAFYVGSIVGSLVLNTSNFTSGITNAERRAQKFQNSLQSLGAAISALGLRMTILGGSITTTSAGLIKLAADAEETANLFKVSMKEMADEAEEFLHTYERSVGGLNTTEQREMMASFNQILGAMGANQEQAFELSKAYTMLANDMSSLRNIPLDEAFVKLTASLAGETEPIRRFGVDIREEILKTQAMADGVIANTSQILTQQQKMYYITQQLFRGLTDDQGDLYRTQTSVTNLMRSTAALVRELGISVGNALIPRVSELLIYSKEYLKVLIDWVNTNPKLAAQLTLIVGVTGIVLITLGGILLILPQIVASIALIGAGIAALISPTGALLAILVVVAAMGYATTTAIRKNLWGIRELVEEIASALLLLPMTFRDVFNEIEGFFRKWEAGAKAVDKFRKGLATGNYLVGKTAFDAFLDGWSEEQAKNEDYLVNGIKQLFSSFVEMQKEGIEQSSAVNFWSEAFKLSKEQLKEDFKSVADFTKSLTKDLIGDVNFESFTNLIEDLKSVSLDIKLPEMPEYDLSALSTLIDSTAIKAEKLESNFKQIGVASLYDIQDEIRELNYLMVEAIANTDDVAIYDINQRLKELNSQLNVTQIRLEKVGIRTTNEVNAELQELRELLSMPVVQSDLFAQMQVMEKIKNLLAETNLEQKMIADSGIRTIRDITEELQKLTNLLDLPTIKNDLYAQYQILENIKNLVEETNIAYQMFRQAGIRTSIDIDMEISKLQHLLRIAQEEKDPVAIKNITTELERLNNELDKLNTSLGNQFLGGFKDGFNELRKEWGDLRGQISSGVSSISNQFTSGIGNAVADVAMQTKDWNTAWTELRNNIIRSLISTAAQMVANYALAMALTAIMATTSATSGASVAAAWAPAAAMVSLATLGTNSVPASAGIIATVATAQGAATVSPVVGGPAGFAEGLTSVPFTGWAKVHQGEKIVPNYDAVNENRAREEANRPQVVPVILIDDIVAAMASAKGQAVIVSTVNEDFRSNGNTRKGNR